MKILLATVVVALIHGSCATLLIKGPTEPVVEGDTVTLECLLSDSEYNISQVHFEIFSTYLQQWTNIMGRFRCFSRMNVERTPDRLTLTIPYAGKYYEGPYRCVSDVANVTAPDNPSEPLSFKVHYMAELSLSREGYSSYLRAPQDLSVRAGDDVVVKCSASSSEEPIYSWYKEDSDWILPSPLLTLKKVSASENGQYTCSAQHPSIASLSKKRTITINVLSKNAPWYQTSDGRLMLMTLAAVGTCLVVILSVSVFFCRRARKIKSSKGPIDDRSQKKPIYKSSSESLPSTCADKQPLV